MAKIKAYFQNMLTANKAVKALNNSGFRGAHLDIPDTFNTEFSIDYGLSSTTNNPNLFSAFLSKRGKNAQVWKEHLYSSDPTVSGIGSSQDMIDKSSTSLIINVEDNNSYEIKNIIEEFGGNIKTILN